jgi:hypothetical protein
MCINAETSLFTFLFGTIINIIIIKKTSNPNYLMMVAIYEFILLMQLLDFFCWRDQACGMQNKFATKAALIQNMLQPVVIILILLIYTQVTSKKLKLIVSLTLLMYIGTVFYKFYYNKSTRPITCLKPTVKCKHLEYGWWSIISHYSIFIYLLPIIVGFYLLLKSKKFAIIHSLYIIISFILSGIVYSCGVPSIFCLFATGGPVLNYLLMKYNV